MVSKETIFCYNESMKNQMSRFQQNTQKRIIQLIIMIMIIVMIIYNLLFWWYASNQQQSSLNQTQTNLKQSLQLVDSALTKISQDITFSQRIKDLFLNKSTVNTVLYDFYTLKQSQKVDAEIIVYDIADTVLLSSIEDTQITNNYSLKLMKDSQMSELRVFRINSKEVYLMNHFSIVEAGERIGTMVLLVPDESFLNLIEYQPSQYSIVSDKKTAYVVSDKQFISGYLSRIVFQDNDKDQEVDGVRYLFSLSEYSDSISIISFIPVQRFNTLMLFGSFLILLIGGLLSIVFLLASRSVVSVSSKSVDKLFTEMKMLSNQEIEFLELESDDELQQVASKINELITNLKQSHHENVELIQKAHQFEHKQLVAQFNPHFLYNTLEAIRSTMYFDPDLSSEMMAYLAKVLRYSLEEKTIVSVNRDIDYLKDYLSLLKHRFGNRLNYVIDNQLVGVPFSIPKLLLQPLIENSLKYGFDSKKDLELKIVFKEENNRLVMSVSDDGPGIKEEVIKKLLEPSSHGIYNSFRRSQLFDSESTFDIITKQKEGTTIVVTLRKMDV